MKFQKIAVFFLLGLSVQACKKDLEKTNVNPNLPEQATPEYLLSNAIKSSADNYYSTANTMDASLLFVQHWSKIQYTDADRYILTNGSFELGWRNYYSQSLTDLKTVAELGDQQSNPNYRAVSAILSSWIFAQLTESYGDVPYTQALDINNLTPKYDTQQSIYAGIIASLKTARDAIDLNGPAISGDLIYAGSLPSWKKLANALLFRAALRIADRDPAQARTIIAEVLVNGGGLITSEAESAKLNYLASPNQNPVAAVFETRDDYRISKTIVDKLLALNDPRLPFYANKPADTSVPQYTGIPNGLLPSDASALGFSRTSKIGDFFTRAVAPAIIINYSETLFDRAEAAARGFSTENAADLYQQGIAASLAYFGIGSAEAATYLASAAVQYDAANYKKSIGEQKWIALFGQGAEAFTEWRRLDYPELKPAVAGALNGQLPKRFIYPGTEQAINKASYTEAVSRQGADALTTRLWFDVQ